MGKLTTHVLNTSTGMPASDMKIELYVIKNSKKIFINSFFTNKDGRLENPLLIGSDFKLGNYQIVFHVGDYQNKTDGVAIENRFLGTIPIQFSMTDDSHYHIPLLYSQFGYSTYRGS